MLNPLQNAYSRDDATEFANISPNKNTHTFVMVIFRYLVTIWVG